MPIGPATKPTDDQLQASYCQSAAEPYHGAIRSNERSPYPVQRPNIGVRLLLHVNLYGSSGSIGISIFILIAQFKYITTTLMVFYLQVTQCCSICKRNTLRCTITAFESESYSGTSIFNILGPTKINGYLCLSALCGEEWKIFEDPLSIITRSTKLEGKYKNDKSDPSSSTIRQYNTLELQGSC